jgi:hypothetical protein
MTCQSSGVGDEGAGSGKPRFKTFVLVLYLYLQYSNTTSKQKPGITLP